MAITTLPATYRTVTLVKRTGASGRLPVGETFEWTFKDRPVEMARVAAFRAMRREYPTEILQDWAVRDDG
jgi:hypothetical protein